MKKFIKALLCLTLVFSICLMFACNPTNDELSFDGKFEKVATSEEITQLVEGIDETKLVNTNSVGLVLGIDFESTSIITDDNVVTTSSLDFDVDVALSVTIPEGEEVPSFGVKIDAAIESMDQESVDGAAPVAKNTTKIVETMIIDKDAVYIDATTKLNGTDRDQKIKIATEEFLLFIQNILPIPPEGDESAPPPSISEVISVIEQIGGKVYIDSGRETKVKISFDKQAIAGLAMMIDPELDPIQFAATLTKGEIDVYLVIGKDGALRGIKFDVDIENSTMDLSLEMVLEMKPVTITSPADPDSYTLVPVEDAL